MQEEDKESKSDCWCLNDYKFGIAVGAGAVVAAPIVLNAAGFTAAGVTAGSAAAGVQSTVYGAAVGAGSVFAGPQSAGAAISFVFCFVLCCCLFSLTNKQFYIYFMLFIHY